MSKGCSSNPDLFCTKRFLEISQNFQENTCAAASFLMQLQALARVFSCEFREIFKYSFSYRRLPLAVRTGDTADISNYRPISVLPYFSKIVERVMYNRLYKYLTDQKNIAPTTT